MDAFRSWLPELCIILSSDILRYIVNVILVVGHEKLNVEMQRAYSSYVTVVKIPKSGGVSQIL